MNAIKTTIQKVTYRKIILFGKNSLCVTLPKEWTTSKKIRKGDSVAVFEKDYLIIARADNPLVKEWYKLLEKKEAMTDERFSNTTN